MKIVDLDRVPTPTAFSCPEGKRLVLVYDAKFLQLFEQIYCPIESSYSIRGIQFLL